MIIPIQEKLLNKDKITIDKLISYDKDYFAKTDILKLDDIHVFGTISKNIEGDIEVFFNVVGEMLLPDAITLESIPYHFDIEIDKKLENSPKTLDLMEFLWHYIVLEIPIRYTQSDIKELKREYSDIYEEGEYHQVNNPFKDFFKE